MNTYDITFIVDPIDEALEERLLDQDVNTGSHGGLHFVMTTIETDDLHSAAVELASGLTGQGVYVHRLDLDLVNQPAIAARCGKSRQAVNLWVQSNAGSHPFPPPYTLAGGALWAWSDVQDWLRRTGKGGDDQVESPRPEQVDRFNVAWRGRSRLAHSAPARMLAQASAS